MTMDNDTFTGLVVLGTVVVPLAFTGILLTATGRKYQEEKHARRSAFADLCLRIFCGVRRRVGKGDKR